MNSVFRCFVVAALLSAWAVAGCANHIPELIPIGNKSVKTGELLEFDVRAKDDDGDPLEFAVQGKPAAARRPVCRPRRQAGPASGRRRRRC